MTIEYRAKQYAQHYADTSNTEQSQYTLGKVVGMQRGYVQGATEQREIDIKKACEWLEKWAYFSVNDMTGSLDEKDLVDRFCKAMKGE